MDFYIKKNSTLPEFQIEISKNGRSDYERNQNLSEITSAYISVINPDNGQYIVASKNCVITQSASTTNPTDISYYLNYQFTNRETSRIGKFEIQISMVDSEGSIILPLDDKIYMNIDLFINDFKLMVKNIKEEIEITKKIKTSNNRNKN